MRQTLTPEEAQAVARLRLEGAGDPSSVRVEDLAETLRISPEEVEFLLGRVHENRTQAAKTQMEEHRKRDLLRVTVAFFIAVLIVVGGFGAYRYREAQIARENDASPTIPNLAPVMKLAEEMGKQAQATADEAAKTPPSPIPPMGTITEFVPPNRLQLGQDGSAEMPSIDGKSMDEIAAIVEKWVAQRRKPTVRSAQADAATLNALKHHSYADPGIARTKIVFQSDQIRDEETLPLYAGSDPEVETQAAAERWRVIGQGLRIPSPYPGPPPAR
ncbi:hypothetical protein BH11ARM2_BH11ARM2_39600 [soil metagenome]